MKDVILRAFKISSPDLNTNIDGLCDRLKDKLSSSLNSLERCMTLNEDDPKQEQDLISYYDNNNPKITFCTMLRITPGKDVAHITDELFKKKLFSVNDLKQTELDTIAIYKTHYHFSLSDKFLVTSLPRTTTITGLQTYINWILQELLEISPLVDENKTAQLDNIKQIQFRDSSVSTPIEANTTQSESSSKNESRLSVKNIALSLVKPLIDAKDLNDIQLSEMISAELLIKFNRPKKSDSEEIKKAYSAILKPISDSENVVFRTRDNKNIISGKELLKTKSVKIDETASGKINEKTLMQEMLKYINELENNEKTPTN